MHKLSNKENSDWAALDNEDFASTEALYRTRNCTLLQILDYHFKYLTLCFTKILLTLLHTFENQVLEETILDFAAHIFREKYVRHPAPTHWLYLVLEIQLFSTEY